MSQLAPRRSLCDRILRIACLLALALAVPGAARAQVDLQPSFISGPVGSAPGDSIRFNFNMSNNGSVTSGTNWIGQFYLSTDNVITTADIPVCSFGGVALAIGTSGWFINCTLSSGLAGGTYFIGLILDRDGTLPETNEGNNAAASAATITICTDSGREPNGTRASASAVIPGVYVGHICGPADQDFHSITVTAGQTITAAMVPPATLNYDLLLQNSVGLTVASSSLGTGVTDSIQYTAPAAGTYYVAVQGRADTLGNRQHNPTLTYTLRLQRLDPLTLTTFVVDPWDAVTADFIATRRDSANVFLAGLNSSAAGWSATHRAAATWNTFVTQAGTGTGYAIWDRNRGSLTPGIYVDTVLITAAGAAGSPSTVVDTLVVAPVATAITPNTTPLASQLGIAGGATFYSFSVPVGATNVTVATGGGTGDVDLYVRKSSLPTSRLWDCRPYVGGNVESCNFTTSLNGVWYVMLRGFSAYSGVTLTVTYTQPLTMTVTKPSGYNWDVAEAGNAVGRADSAVVTLSGTNAGSTTWIPSHRAAATWVTLNTAQGVGTGVLRWTRNASALTAGTYIDTIMVTAVGVPSVIVLDTFVVGTITNLASGVPVTNIADATGSGRLYRIFAGSGLSQLLVTTSGGTGDVDLYLRSFNTPSLTTYTCASGSATTTESCNVSTPAQGDWFILLHGWAAYSGVTLTATTNTTLTLSAARVASQGWDAAFSAQSDNRSDSVTVTLAGPSAGSTNWTATHSASATWVTPGTSSGTGSGVARWQRNPAALAAGVRVDTITITAAGAAGSPFTIYDTLAIDAAEAPLTSGVAVTALAGGVGSVQYFRINVPAGAPTLTFTTVPGTGSVQLAVGPPGQAPNGQSFATNVCLSQGPAPSCNISNPSAQSYYAYVRGLTAYTGYSLTATASATLTLAVSPASRSAGVVSGSTSPVADSADVTLTGAGAGSAAWTASHRPAATWVTLTNAAGTGTGKVRWVRNPTGLAVGLYIDTITVAAPGAVGSPAIVVDTFQVLSTTATIALSPVSRTVSAGQGATTALPDTATLSITGATAGSTAWTVTHRAAATWLTLMTTAGTGPGFVAYSRNPTGLATGSYVDTITVTSPGAIGSPARLIDTLVVQPSLSLALAPGSRKDSIVAGTAGNRLDSALVALSGFSGQNTLWTATHRANAAWLTLNTASGTGTGYVRWTRAYAGLAAGLYIDTISVTAAGATGSPARVIDTLVVAQALTMAVSPAVRRDTTFVGLSGQRPDSAAVTLSGAGGTTTGWTATHRTAATWVTFTNPSGTGSGMVRWTRTHTGLAVGTYVDSIRVAATGAAGSPALVLDTLVVLAVPVSGNAAATGILNNGSGLSPAQIQYLDQQGNNNGGFDIGDFLAFVRKNPGAVSPERLAEVMSRQGGRPAAPAPPTTPATASPRGVRP